MFKETLCSLEKWETENVIIYNIIEVLIQTEKYVLFKSVNKQVVLRGE